jgi:hypothetical protein
MAHISRRIKNESKMWETRINENYHLFEDENKIEVCIFNIGYVSHLFLIFEISFEYPFKPPKIYLNGKNFKRYLPSGKLFREDLKKILDKSNCLCCSSITCNWGPTLNIINIVDEIRNFLNIKLKLVEIFFTRKLVNRIPIELCEIIISYL